MAAAPTATPTTRPWAERPKGLIEWGTLRQNFVEGKTAIMWHSTGNLTAVMKEAKFDVGVAPLPAHTGAPGLPAAFTGADQLRALAEDPVFRQALRNNALYAAVTVPLSVGLALAMALWVQGRFAGRGLLPLAFFTPTVLPMVAAANLWLIFYAPDIGLLNRALAWAGLHGPNWLGDAGTALWALMAVTVWKEAGFFMVFYLAALQSLSPELMDAARLEAPSAWTRLRRVTLPLLAPTTLFVGVNALINAVKLVDHLFVLTRGGPNNASTLLLYDLYEIAFKFQDLNHAAALTPVLLALLGAVSAAQFWLARRIHCR